jgi:hypothetical protein
VNSSASAAGSPSSGTGTPACAPLFHETATLSPPNAISRRCKVHDRRRYERCRRYDSASHNIPRSDQHPICQQITSEKNPLNPCFSVLALMPQMTREIQDQQPTAARQYSSYRSAHHTSALKCACRLGEEKANRNSRISEIGLCSGKQATKRFSNRNKNAFFALSKGPEIGEKRS